jgi:hypothetical protein
MQDLLSTLNDAADGVLGFLGDLGDYGAERVTKTRIRRVQGYIVKWEAKVKTAKSGYWKDRAQRKLDKYKRQLREMKAELKKDMERREGKGKDWRYDKTRAAMLGIDKKKKKAEVDTVSEAYIAASKEVPKNLNKAIFLGRVKATYPALRAGLAKGLGYRVAVMAAVGQSIPATLIAYRAPVMDHYLKYEAAYSGRPVFKPASPALVGGGAVEQSKANRDRHYQRMAMIRMRMARAAQDQSRTSDVETQRQLAAMQAQHQQQLAAMQTQYQQLQAAYAQQAQQAQVPVLPPPALPTAQQTQERSGAFQAFPYSTALETQASASAPESAEADEADAAEGAEGAEEVESTDMELGEDSEETPFYKNPAVIVGALIVSAIAYNQFNKKKGKGQGQSTP